LIRKEEKVDFFAETFMINQEIKNINWQ